MAQAAPTMPMRDDLPDAAQRRASRGDAVILTIAVLGFAFCSIAAAVRSQGFLESDGGTHYLYARFALAEPYYLTDVWGRPLCTGLYCLPAHWGGLIGVRLTSLALALGIAFASAKIARGQGMAHPGLAAVCTLGMPLLFLHSFAELTELPFATVVAFAFLSYQLRKFGAMALLISLAPLGRPEGFGLLLLAAIALLLHRRWYLLPLLLAPLIGWDFAGYCVFKEQGHWWLWLPQHWPYSENSTYAAGSIFHFVMLMPMLIGPLLFPAVWVGLALNLGKILDWRSHIARCRFLTALLPLGVLGVHSLLFAMGKMASSGELRYLLVMAPLWAVSTAWGWQWLIDALAAPSARRAMVQWAALAAVAPGCVNYFYRVLPLELPTRWLEAQRAVAWYAQSPLRAKYPRVMAAHPAIFYFLDISPTDPDRVVQWTADNAMHPPAGTIVFWDPESSMGNADRARIISLSTLMQGGWVNDVRSEWKSNINNPPPWANYKVTNPPKEPKDQLLPDTPMLWHIFESAETVQGSATPSAVQEQGGITWAARPMGAH